MSNELFETLTSNIHFNVTEMGRKTWNQNWMVPENLITIVGLKNGKKPVFYYGLTENYRTNFVLKKGTSENRITSYNVCYTKLLRIQWNLLR